MISCLAFAVVCALAGTIPSMDEPVKSLDSRSSGLRSAAAALGLIALLLVPVFVMMNTYTFSRQIGLMDSGVITEGKEALFARLDGFLFEGRMGDNIDAALQDLNFGLNWKYWLLVPAMFAIILSAVQLRHGSVENAVIRGVLYAFIIVVCVVTLYPYYVMIITAFSSNAVTTEMFFLHMFPT